MVPYWYIDNALSFFPGWAVFVGAAPRLGYVLGSRSRKA